MLSHIALNRSISGISSAATMMRKHIWIWPIVACILLAVLGWGINRAIESTMKEQLAGELTTILNADVAALRLWLRTQEAGVQAIVQSPAVFTAIDAVLKSAQAAPQGSSGNPSPEALRLEAALAPWLEANDYEGYDIIHTDRTILASSHPELIGKELHITQNRVRERLSTGESTVSRPFPSQNLMTDFDGQVRAGVPLMYVLAPIMGADGELLASLALRISPEKEFTDILNIARPGQSGETYAFDRQGLLLSGSRFDDQLKEIGLLVDKTASRSILNIDIRDPEVDMTKGARPTLRRPDQPLTRMAADAVKGNSGFDVDGYNDYRGVPVIGAWTWLPEYALGVATEMDLAEAYRPTYILRWAFGGLFALLITSAVAIFVFTIVIGRLNRTARRAALEVKKLGQYTLEEQIGQGGMGTVYRGTHAMLRRPTAIKLLDIEKTTPESIRRFEREVQLTSQLQHPNTIEIYDYGRTDEGIFYYAMEHLDGIDLENLIERFGRQPEARVVHMLEQACGSLVEAHEMGLIHRDIKPANIFMNRRAGMFDVIKLLDFGLVKAVDAKAVATLTQSNTWMGTPLYMAPEAFSDPGKVDARTDLYAIGAVAYFLATAASPFQGPTIAAICNNHLNNEPTPPSHLCDEGTLSQPFEDFILKCLQKEPGDRPQTARELIEMLRRCPTFGAWTQQSAEAWWTANLPRDETPDKATSKEKHQASETVVMNSDSFDE